MSKEARRSHLFYSNQSVYDLSDIPGDPGSQLPYQKLYPYYLEPLGWGNEKELIRPRRLCLRRELPEPGAHNFACGANYHTPVWFNFACGANYHIPGWFNYACGANYHIPGWFNYACGANYPYQALKGGLFCICVESTNLT